MKKIMVVGGAGYIGSHTCIELLQSGYEIVVIDNLSNSSSESLRRIEEICDLKEKIDFHKVDIKDSKTLSSVFSLYDIDVVIHFAAYKSVGESLKKPLEYYENNISGTISLLKVMKEHGCKHIIFSSSANVYGDLASSPIEESSSIDSNNPYGFTKILVEKILNDLYLVDDSWKIVILRYFNPVGAHKSQMIGESSKYQPTNLIPSITQAIIDKKKIKVFGNTYNTHDGTGIRDYIHVSDLAAGHVKAIQLDHPGIEILNIGTGKGYSVLEVIEEFEKILKIKIEYEVYPKRDGDIAISYADSRYAKKVLGWEPTRSLRIMCEDAWNWKKNNPNGF